MNGKNALEGLRILDFTWVLAGPGAVRYLADHGAQVIKVERIGEGDIGRRVMPFREGVRGVNLSGYYNNINRGKLGITVNLADPRGIDVIKKLVRISDVVVENFTADVMTRLGLNYDVLKEIKSDIIMISMAGCGHSGAYRDYTCFGPTLQALSGITCLMGTPDRDPVGFGFSYSDFTGGWAGVLAILQALHYRKRTGQGQWVDVSQLETLCALMGPGMLDYSVNKRDATRMGNRLPWGNAAPHGAYRCKGDDRWCVISVFNDTQWRSFCRAIGNPEWTKEEKFSTVISRSENADELDRFVEKWTIQYTDKEVMETLQKAGIAAGRVQNSKDLVEDDPQIQHRDFFQEIEHPEIGRVGYEGVSFKLSDTPGYPHGPAPLLGRHNDIVFGEFLGMSKEEIEHYKAEGVF
ncbi:MAG: CoA transferase [Thermodesulfobacteriota bacterium]|nr:CoA transferase [Thermodesulfobacteriota bacterium]